MEKDKKQLTELELIETVRSLYPLIDEKCQDDTIIFDNEEFAPDFQLTEMMKLGMVIKYAGLHEKDIKIVHKKGKK